MPHRSVTHKQLFMGFFIISFLVLASSQSVYADHPPFEEVGDDHTCSDNEEPVIMISPTVDGGVVTWTQDPTKTGFGGHHVCAEPNEFDIESDSFSTTVDGEDDYEAIVIGLECETTYLVTVITSWIPNPFSTDDTSASTFYTTLTCPETIDPIVIGSTVNIVADGETIQTATDEYTEFCTATDETSPTNPECTVQSGGINTNVLGLQTVTYEATDDAGNVGTVTVTTTVIALTCDEGFEVVNFVCVLIILNCDEGFEQVGIECVLIILNCDEGFEQVGIECVLIILNCDEGFEQVGIECVLIILNCDEGFEQVGIECVLIILNCDEGFEQVGIECVLIVLNCDEGFQQVETECVLIILDCDEGFEQVGIECVLIVLNCDEGFEFNLETNQCEAKPNGSTCHVPPTFGTPFSCTNGRNFVDDGITIHGVTYDPTNELHIKNPQIDAVVGKTYSIKLAPYESEGQFSIKWVGVSIGLLDGDFIFGNGQALAYLYQSHEGTFTVEENDPTDIIEIISFSKVGEQRCAVIDNDAMCPIYELKYKYREAPIGNMLGVQVVNIDGESENRFFNDGIDVTGNSMNPSPVIEVNAKEKLIAYHYLTYTDPSFKDRTIAVDENGIVWNQIGNFWTTDHLMPDRACGVSSFGFARTCPEFTMQMQGQELLAIHTMNTLYPNVNRDESFSEIDRIFAYEYPTTSQRELTLQMIEDCKFLVNKC